MIAGRGLPQTLQLSFISEGFDETDSADMGEAEGTCFGLGFLGMLFGVVEAFGLDAFAFPCQVLNWCQELWVFWDLIAHG